MRFKLDENLPDRLAVLLRGADHEVDTVLDEGIGGAPDSLIIEVCRAEGRVLVTLDLDFADIRSYPPDHYAGIVVLRLPRHDLPTILAAGQRLVRFLTQEPISGRLWILEPVRLRIRGSDA